MLWPKRVTQLQRIMDSPSIHYLFVASDDSPVGEKVVGHAADGLLDAQAKAVLHGMFVLSLGPSHYRQHAARDQL